MQTYKIVIHSLSDAEDKGELNFNQVEMDNFLFSGAPYNESLLRSEQNNAELIDTVSISVETSGEFYGWVGKYYPKEIYTLMVISAVKQSAIKYLFGLPGEPTL